MFKPTANPMLAPARPVLAIRVARALGACAVIGVASLVLLELLVRLTMPQPVPQLWLEANERYGHVMRADYAQDATFEGTDFVMEVRTNAWGLRDEAPPPHRPGVPTVVFLGDSFTFGHGVQVEERFDSLFEDELVARGIPVRVLNVGVNAWGTLQATRYLADHLDRFQPDVVVLTFCENDPFDDTYFLEHGISFDRVTFPGKRWLRAHSHLFRFAQQQYLLWRKRQTMAAEAAQPAAAPAEPPAELAQAHAAPPIPEQDWARTERYIVEFMDALRDHNPNARLVLQATAPWDDAIAARLADIATRIEGAAYEPLPEVAALPPEARHLPYDGHWSRRVHALVAKALAARLAS